MTTRTAVLELLRRSDRRLTPDQVARRLALPYERVKKSMQRMAAAGELQRDRGRYSAASPDAPGSGDTPPEPRDTTPGNGPRVRVLRDAWEDPPRPPRWVDRWFDR